ncbi:DUF1684 domain-containing protein [Maribacter chungangensis]|uniref:DUF1684 domain-containing protein n=1 Tax=Maribacter chungangensis TaxID=1069117 RepID=A0ABW3B0T2_9FLAO
MKNKYTMRFQWNTLILFVILTFGCKEGKKYHDEKVKNSVVASSDKIAAILEFQESLNAEFKHPERSPLPDRFRSNFESLEFFAPDTNYVVTAKLVRTPEALPFLMPTNTGRTSEEVVYGVVTFNLKGKAYSLEVYQNPELIEDKDYEDYLFLPFSDHTNGDETYSGGRYLDLRIPPGNSLVLDFNQAYNPYCAYNPKYSCPLVPAVNRLETSILAGVKDFKK